MKLSLFALAAVMALGAAVSGCAATQPAASRAAVASSAARVVVVNFMFSSRVETQSL